MMSFRGSFAAAIALVLLTGASGCAADAEATQAETGESANTRSTPDAQPVESLQGKRLTFKSRVEIPSGEDYVSLSPGGLSDMAARLPTSAELDVKGRGYCGLVVDARPAKRSIEKGDRYVVDRISVRGASDVEDESGQLVDIFLKNTNGTAADSRITCRVDFKGSLLGDMLYGYIRPALEVTLQVQK